MNLEEAKQVEEYFSAGYIVMISGTGFVDSPVDAITEVDSELVYNSEVFYERPLSEVEMFNVAISMPLHDISTGKSIENIGDIGEYELKKIDGKEV